MNLGGRSVLLTGDIERDQDSFDRHAYLCCLR